MTNSASHHAQLRWDEQGQPLSSNFDDVYFSKANGLEESRYVFLQHNQLAERFALLKAGDNFVVAETGFGTGLNFLACWQCFQQHAPIGARLQFISVEKYPLLAADLQQALALWPELASLSQQLQQQYLLIQPGFQQLVFEQGRVSLSLLIGEASEQLAQLDAKVDAWFLDGFAPSKNPQMWSPELFTQLARLAHTGTTLATFTSAGFVRRGLIEAGFKMQRQPGFGRKREMLSGIFNPEPDSQPPAQWQTPWFARPEPASRQQERRAIVIGAGISGCASAYSLALRGWQVCILERNAAPAMEASGNPQGILYPKLSAHHTELSQLILAGYGYTRRLLSQWPQEADFSLCGLLQLAFDEKEHQRQQQLVHAFDTRLMQSLTSSQASDLAGVELKQPALLFPDSGWIKPAKLCEKMLQHPNIELRCQQNVMELQYVEQQWQALGKDGLIAQAPVLIIANANAANSFSQSAHLPLRSIHGQITSVPATATSQSLQLAISGEGYIAPAHNGTHCLGASHSFQRQDCTLNAADHEENLTRLYQLSPQLYQAVQAQQLDSNCLDGHAALRCSSPDYLPIIGPLACQQQFADTYAQLAKNARAMPTQKCPWLPGLYVNTAHGSRGMITAPLSGEILAAWICNQAQIIPEQIVRACHPNRFSIRQLIRNQKPANCK